MLDELFACLQIVKSLPDSPAKEKLVRLISYVIAEVI